jgi:hypothetical protein
VPGFAYLFRTAGLVRSFNWDWRAATAIFTAFTAREAGRSSIPHKNMVEPGSNGAIDGPRAIHIDRLGRSECYLIDNAKVII